MKIRRVQKSDVGQWAALRAALWPVAKDGYIAELTAFFAGEDAPLEQAFVLENERAQLCGFIELNLRNNVRSLRHPCPAPVPFRGRRVCGRRRFVSPAPPCP